MKQRFLLSVLAFTGALCASVSTPAKAQEMGSLPYYALSQSDYRDHYQEWQRFLEYNLHREQCQHYVEPPTGYYMKGCQLYRKEAAVAMIQPSAGEVTKLSSPSVIY